MQIKSLNWQDEFFPSYDEQALIDSNKQKQIAAISIPCHSTWAVFYSPNSVINVPGLLHAYLTHFDAPKNQEIHHAFVCFSDAYNQANSLAAEADRFDFSYFIVNNQRKIFILIECLGVKGLLLLTHLLETSLCALKEFIDFILIEDLELWDWLKEVISKISLETTSFDAIEKAILQASMLEQFAIVKKLHAKTTQVERPVQNLCSITTFNELSRNLDVSLAKLLDCNVNHSMFPFEKLFHLTCKQYHLLVSCCQRYDSRLSDPFFSILMRISEARRIKWEVIRGTNIPRSLYAYLNYFDLPNKKQLLKSFESFIERFQKSNSFADEEHRIDIEEFILSNQHKIYWLVECLGESALSLLSSFLGPSALALKRFVDSIDITNVPAWKPFKITLNKLSLDNVSMPLLEKTILHVSAILHLLSKLDNQYPMRKTIENKLTGISTLMQFLEATTSLQKEMLAHLLQIPADTINLSRLPTELVGKLILAGKHMQNNNCASVYFELLKADLKPSATGFLEFSEDVNQTSPLGKNLSLHNARVTTLLRTAGIDLELMRNYPRSVSFSTASIDAIDMNEVYRNTWSFLLELYKAVKSIIPGEHDTDFKQGIEGLKKDIRKIKDKILKGETAEDISQEALKRLNEKSQQDLIRNLCDKIKEYKSKHPVPGVLASVYEFSDHLRESLVHITKANAKQAASLKTSFFKPKTYHIEVWDKSRLDTFILGDYVGCCLATNGTRFEAMVQRRMDKAMQFIVVIDDASNEPVALTWLFFAHSRNDPQAIYLVSNFFEMRASYAQNTTVRQALLNRLIRYTGDYARAIKCGYLMRQLTYGWMITDIHLPIVNIQIAKVGGYFNPSHADMESLEKLYYLDAIDMSSFHFYYTRHEQIKDIQVPLVTTDQSQASAAAASIAH